jgi:nucleoside-diphosphate-sugar epimerase
VAPAGIYGVGEGIKKLSFGIPVLFEAIQKRGKVFAVNEGQNTMAASHVKDVADVLVMFAEEALEVESQKIAWGGDAFYYVESGGYVFADLAAAAAKLMVEKGLIGSEVIERISAEEVLELHFAGGLMWASNMDVKADRLRGLGWEPKQKDVYDYLEEMLPQGV